MFKSWPKIPRLENEVYHITEKIDGTNACIIIKPIIADEFPPVALYYQEKDGISTGVGLWAQSRTRLLTINDDNYIFAKWAKTNAEQLIQDLGEGYHFGEWWGQGIQRNYGLTEKRFSLFNPTKQSSICHNCTPVCSITGSLEVLNDKVNHWKKHLILEGSIAVPGYMRPEGLVVYAEKAKTHWKVIIDKETI